MMSLKKVSKVDKKYGMESVTKNYFRCIFHQEDMG